jgi:glycosyltransferase involved in cell wall biosynthesis
LPTSSASGWSRAVAHGLAGLGRGVPVDLGAALTSPPPSQPWPASLLGRRPVMLHITGDYPDPVREPTTEAVRRLIDSLPAFDHVTFSLKRFADPRKVYMIECARPAPNQRLFAFGHFGLPFGAGLRAMFKGVAAHIDHTLQQHDLHPDIIHSHRLTFDGIAGHVLSRRRRLPHIVSVRGEVESKVIRAKPTYRPLVRRIANEADLVLYVSAWFRPALEQLAPRSAAKGRLFPNIVANVGCTIGALPMVDRFVTAARLDAYRQKGIDRLIRGIARARPVMGDIGLDIYGTGSAANVAQLQRLIDGHGLGRVVELKGRVPNDVFLGRLPSYIGLALPSRNETFGMVYTEALFAGIPILYARESGIDGFVDGIDAGTAVRPDNIADITAALIHLARYRDDYRAEIRASQAELERRFAPHAHLAQYADDVVRLVASRRTGARSTAEMRSDAP